MSADISVGLLEFIPTDENLLKLGKMVWDKLMSDDCKKSETYMVNDKEETLCFWEVIVRGS